MLSRTTNLTRNFLRMSSLPEDFEQMAQNCFKTRKYSWRGKTVFCWTDILWTSGLLWFNLCRLMIFRVRLAVQGFVLSHKQVLQTWLLYLPALQRRIGGELALKSGRVVPSQVRLKLSGLRVWHPNDSAQSFLWRSAGCIHRMRHDVIFFGQNLPKNSQKLVRHMTSWTP